MILIRRYDLLSKNKVVKKDVPHKKLLQDYKEVAKYRKELISQFSDKYPDVFIVFAIKEI